MKDPVVRRRNRLHPDVQFRRRYWLFWFFVAGFGFAAWEWWQLTA